MNSRIKIILWLFLLNTVFVVFVFLLRHAWYIFQSGAESARTIYPRFHFLFILFGQNVTLIFTILFIVVLLLNILSVFRLISLYKGTATAILFFSSIVLSVVLAEIILGALGYVPGLQFWSRYSFRPVKKLEEIKGFYADESGILKIDSECRKEIEQNIAQRKTNYTAYQASEVYELTGHYGGIVNGTVKNCLSKVYSTITQKPEIHRTEWESAVVNYIHNPINTDGFRSIEFKKYSRSKPSVLLLGDSFTWGHSAKNKTNSFADILLSKGYVVYNTGITTTDVAQYLAVAQKYIPVLQPDFVIVNFYLGNDITYYKRNVLPYHSTFYCTNAGYLLACPHGKYLTKEEAYRYTLLSSQIPINHKNILDRWATKTIIGTYLKIHFNINITPYLTAYFSPDTNNILKHYYEQVEKRKYSVPYSNQELEQIKKLAEKYGAEFILSSIPDFSTGTLKTTKDFPDLFGGLLYHEMSIVSEEYENGSKIHFNDKGHEKYAVFLDSLIRMNTF